jgi:hypothetical protein
MRIGLIATAIFLTAPVVLLAAPSTAYADESPVHTYSDPDSGDLDVAIDVPSNVLTVTEVAAVDESTPTVTAEALDQFQPLAPNPADPGDGDDCTLRVDFPHSSSGYQNEIHTRVTSSCSIPLTSNTVRAKTYRWRWYGWQKVADLPAQTKYAGSSTVQNYRRTIVARCGNGSYYKYETEGFGTITDGAGNSYSAQAYEKNDSAIQCLA